MILKPHYYAVPLNLFREASYGGTIHHGGILLIPYSSSSVDFQDGFGFYSELPQNGIKVITPCS